MLTDVWPVCTVSPRKSKTVHLVTHLALHVSLLLQARAS